jgi:DNA-binding PadR family transcriptional regulator
MKKSDNSKMAVLGLLCHKPMTGYDIKKTIAQSTGMFWSESYGQIYPTLKKLTREGLAVVQQSERRGAASKTSYAPTAKGRNTIKTWLAQPAKTNIIRSETLLKIFFGGQADLLLTQMHIEQELADSRQALAVLTTVEKMLAQRSNGRRNLTDFHFRLTIAYGKKSLTATVRWCKDSLRKCSEWENSERKDGVKEKT